MKYMLYTTDTVLTAHTVPSGLIHPLCAHSNALLLTVAAIAAAASLSTL